MKINSQNPNINIGLISRLIFIYQKLTRKFLELFQIFTNFNLEYFFFTIIYELWRILLPFKIGEPCQKTYMNYSHKNLLGIRAYNKFEMLDLFIGVNLYFEPKQTIDQKLIKTFKLYLDHTMQLISGKVRQGANTFHSHNQSFTFEIFYKTSTCGFLNDLEQKNQVTTPLSQHFVTSHPRATIVN